MPSRLFASDGLLKPQDGSKMAQESPKRGSREPQDGPKNAQERSKSGPRGRQDALFEPPRGGPELITPLFLSHGAQDGPKRPPRPPQRAPRGLQDPPKEPQAGPKKTPRGPQEGPKMAPQWHYESSKHPSSQHIPTCARDVYHGEHRGVACTDFHLKLQCGKLFVILVFPKTAAQLHASSRP